MKNLTAIQSTTILVYTKDFFIIRYLSIYEDIKSNVSHLIEI